jgi:hypothetical protein
MFAWTRRLESSARCWTCKACTYDNNPLPFLACDMCQTPKGSPGEDDKVPDEVEHAVVDGGGAHKRKRVDDIDRPTSPQSPAPRSKAPKVGVQDSGLLTPLPLDLMARPIRQSRNWREYNCHNCTGAAIPTRVLQPPVLSECIQRPKLLQAVTRQCPN